MKKILIVTYGGGHVRMIEPVIAELKKDKSIKVEVIALTTAGMFLDSVGIINKGFRHFIFEHDKDAIYWGEKLLLESNLHNKNVCDAETVAYLGLSYVDLIYQIGEKAAHDEYLANGRQAFLPIRTMKRIVSEIAPDVILTTNSPRAEHAAIIVGKEYGISTVSMEDLFGLFHYKPLIADYITVMSKLVITNLKKKYSPAKKYYITGNPAFDVFFKLATDRLKGKKKYKYFNSCYDDKKTVLWLEQSRYVCQLQGNLSFHSRTEQEVCIDLNSLYEATLKENVYVLLRHHPSESGEVMRRWYESVKPAHMFIDEHRDLYEILGLVDVVIGFTSTVLLQAVISGCKVIQMKDFGENTDMPLSANNLAIEVTDRQDLRYILQQILYGESMGCVGDIGMQGNAAIKVKNALIEIAYSN